MLGKLCQQPNIFKFVFQNSIKDPILYLIFDSNFSLIVVYLTERIQRFIKPSIKKTRTYMQGIAELFIYLQDNKLNLLEHCNYINYS